MDVDLDDIDGGLPPPPKKVVVKDEDLMNVDLDDIDGGLPPPPIDLDDIDGGLPPPKPKKRTPPPNVKPPTKRGSPPPNVKPPTKRVIKRELTTRERLKRKELTFLGRDRRGSNLNPLKKTTNLVKCSRKRKRRKNLISVKLRLLTISICSILSRTSQRRW